MVPAGVKMQQGVHCGTLSARLQCCGLCRGLRPLHSKASHWLRPDPEKESMNRSHKGAGLHDALCEHLAALLMAMCLCRRRSSMQTRRWQHGCGAATQRLRLLPPEQLDASLLMEALTHHEPKRVARLLRRTPPSTSAVQDFDKLR